MKKDKMLAVAKVTSAIISKENMKTGVGGVGSSNTEVRLLEDIRKQQGPDVFFRDGEVVLQDNGSPEDEMTLKELVNYVAECFD